ncbi:interleukin-25 [Rhineura floridana]|uniref:interleukin-25 n=1 Tax=Rhineura floridana TaxID=261503 RepID=UPI002AC850BF|nr:interleukin-25 [Rhineura floridana]
MTLLAVMCIALSAFLPSQAFNCISHCCNKKEIDDIGNRLTISYPKPPNMSSTQDCHAFSSGTDNKRSTSPWKYVEDFNGTRYPQRLWRAECSCPSCISLREFVQEDHQRVFSTWELNGNSILVTCNTLVYNRVPCKKNPNLFSLQPAYYQLPVSCTCLAARLSSHKRK